MNLKIRALRSRITVAAIDHSALSGISASLSSLRSYLRSKRLAFALAGVLSLIFFAAAVKAQAYGSGIEQAINGQPTANFHGKFPAFQRAVRASSRPESRNLILVRNGVALYHIHVGSNADIEVLAAAESLADLIGKISGANFSNLSRDDNPLDGPLVIVGRDNELAKKLWKDVSWDDLGEDGFIIRTTEQYLLIAGKTAGGTMYGVNWFLDHKLGVKWVAPDYVHIPSSQTIELPLVHETQVPRFRFRQILSVEGQDKQFAAHNLLNGNSHGAYDIHSPAKIDHWDNSWQRPGLAASFYELIPPSGIKPHIRTGMPAGKWQ